MSIEYTTTCPACGDPVVVDLCALPEQKGGPETEYLPACLDHNGQVNCGCGYEFTKAEEEQVLCDAERELGR